VAFGQLKGLDVLLRAAAHAFAGERRVVLRIHQRKGGLEELLADDSRAAAAFARLGRQVVVSTGPLTQDQMARLYAGVDLYVQPSRAEASGLTALEAACCGTPSVATAWSGPTDYIDGKAVLPLAYTLTEARPRRFQQLARGGCGLWAEPSVEHLAEILHEVHANREERAAAARAAAPGLRARFGLDAVGRTAESLLFDASRWEP
jgi:glycosyltransferase involved in cell wall biosynthesis